LVQNRDRPLYNAIVPCPETTLQKPPLSGRDQVGSWLVVKSLDLGSPVVKKGRHRRFEEARKLKQSGPGAFDLGFGDRSRETPTESSEKEPDKEPDEYAALAEKYGVTFEDDEDNED
jgi:hypothetical protein